MAGKAFAVEDLLLAILIHQRAILEVLTRGEPDDGNIDGLLAAAADVIGTTPGPTLLPPET